MEWVFRNWYWAAEVLLLLTVCMAGLFVIGMQKERREKKLKKAENAVGQVYEDVYDELLKEVRMRQRNYQNQLLALQDVCAQEALKKEREDMQMKYADSLREAVTFDIIHAGCGNPILAGSLYYKCIAAENAGIVMDLSIGVGQAECKIPVYHIIEMLGIFMDYAVQSLLDDQEDKKMMVMVKEMEKKIVFEVGSTVKQHISREEKEQIFQDAYDSQGKNFSQGLNHIKQIIDEYRQQLFVLNVVKDGLNWLVFQIVVDKNKECRHVHT